ncbi:Hsp20/alpha crystallin family protein [Candidatus Harpocratesius sp.]
MTYQFAHIKCGYNHPPLDHILHQYAPFMPYDLEETADEYLITMPLPGFKADAVHISLSRNSINIEAEPPNTSEKAKNTEEKEKARKIVSMGKYIWNRPVKVEIPVNDEIEEGKVKARLKNGLLKVSFTKKPKITVKVEEEQ